jgi:hypothetical protein
MFSNKGSSSPSLRGVALVESYLLWPQQRTILQEERIQYPTGHTSYGLVERGSHIYADL